MTPAARRRLFLHIGQTKAGSTSLQNWLEGRHDWLLERGKLFPHAGFLRGNGADPSRSAGHLHLLRLISDGSLGDFEAELAAAPDADLILSIENLFLDQPDAALSRLGEYFHDWDMTLILVLRPQLDWLRSRHVENVMSGFHCSTRHLPDLAAEARAAGRLDYRARLAHVQALLGADHVKALAYDAGALDPGLIPRMLAAMGVDAPPDAAQIRANTRGRDPDLLEAKRRLNSLTGSMMLQDRLRLEHQLRQTARATRLRADDRAARVGFDHAQLVRMQAGNDALLAEGVLDHPLGTGRPDALTDAPVNGPRMTELFEAGLRLAADLAWQAEDFDRFSDSPLGLTEGQRDALMAALRRNPVSLHVDSAGTALLAAQGEGAFPCLLLSPRPEIWKKLASLDRLVTVSPLLALELPVDLAGGQGNGIADILRTHHVPAPGLIVAGRGCDIGLIAQLLTRHGPAELVILDPTAERLEALSPDGWQGQQWGDDMLTLWRNEPGGAGR